MQEHWQFELEHAQGQILESVAFGPRLRHAQLSSTLLFFSDHGMFNPWPVYHAANPILASNDCSDAAVTSWERAALRLVDSDVVNVAADGRREAFSSPGSGIEA